MDFYLAIQGLKRTKRQGWVNNQISNPESVADHMYRMAVIAMSLGIDSNKLIKMCLVHDLAECIVGDITPMDNVSNADKHARELAAMKQLVTHLDCGTEIMELWLEYENAQTETALLCKDIDKFEMILQAYEYEKEKRKQEADRIRSKYPDRIPCIVERQDKSDITSIDKKKYLVPCDLTVGQFVYVIRKRIKLSPEKAIFIFVNNVLPPTASLLSQVYSEHKDADGFLYIVYSSENTFG